MVGRSLVVVGGCSTCRASTRMTKTPLLSPRLKLIFHITVTVIIIFVAATSDKVGSAHHCTSRLTRRRRIADC